MPLGLRSVHKWPVCIELADAVGVEGVENAVPVPAGVAIRARNDGALTDHTWFR